MSVITLSIILLYILLFTLIIYFYIYKPKEPEPVWVYCIMITGKDRSRICFAKKSVENFLSQDYKYKKLVIINHSQLPVLNESSSNTLYEFHVPRSGNTLGDLRNIALQLVPINAIWTLWDDDDYRSTKYLSFLYNNLISSKSDVVLFTRRYECNYNTKFVWEMEIPSGFVIVFAKQDLRVKYLQKDSMEDVQLIDDFRKLGKKINVITNDPSIYIRLVHNNNTSLYVDKYKTKLIDTQKNIKYHEKHVDDSTRNEILKLIDMTFFSEGTCDFGKLVPQEADR